MKITHEELATRFDYHPPNTDGKIRKHEFLRQRAHTLAEDIRDECPPCREVALAITKLEEALFWANAAVARRE